MWFSSLIGYSAFAAAHALTTWLAFRRLSGERFAATLARIAPPQSWRTRNGRFRVLTGSADGLSWSSQVAFFALIAVGTLTFMKETDSWVWAGPLTALTVVTAWVDVMLSFSVQYARVYHSEGGMQFPADGRTPPDEVAYPGSSTDFFYQSAMTQATFGSTDVSITSRRMRRLVTGHSLLSFIFNTIIITTLVSQLV